MDGKIILFAIIILVFLCITNNINVLSILLSTIALIILNGLFNKNKKNKETEKNEKNKKSRENLINEHATDQGISDVDNYNLSKYGNISISQDVDMTKQEVDLPEGENALDNTDVVDQVITRGTSLMHSKPDSFSPTVNHNTFEMKKKYNIGLTGKQDADEMLARKQSQRGALNRDAMTGFARHTANKYYNSFEDELDENEHRVWWSSESQDLETDWTPY